MKAYALADSDCTKHWQFVQMIASIHELTPRQFADALGNVASHSKPIDELSHLKGRESQVEEVKEAIYAKGRHIFIYGERGVGKTSLAKTVGRASATDSSMFKQIGCSTDSSFADLLRQIVEVFDRKRLAEVEKKIGFGIDKILSFHSGQKETYTPTNMTVSSAADILASLDADGTNSIRVVLVDEIDRLGSSTVKRDFAELIKLLGDRGALITFIFTGVGSDLEEILGYHPSSFRQLTQVKLERINYQSALDIIDDALARFRLSWEVEPIRTARFRIAGIANGFPYYVHLLVEKLLYQLYRDRGASEITLNHLRDAISSAVQGAQEEIRKHYDRAARGRNEVYKHVTWAVADAWDLERNTTQIYKSYLAICDKLGVAPAEQRKVIQVLASLKKDSYGPILCAGFRKGLYQYTENIVRGYVRLCALSEGVELNDLGPEEAAPRALITGREKRYVDPRRLGGPPKDLRR